MLCMRYSHFAHCAVTPAMTARERTNTIQMEIDLKRTFSTSRIEFHHSVYVDVCNFPHIKTEVTDIPGIYYLLSGRIRNFEKVC